jgi:hypothetical protein
MMFRIVRRLRDPSSVSTSRARELRPLEQPGQPHDGGGRPYQHNDNAHIEQRNGDWIRRHAFRYRYETDAEMTLLNELWDLVMARKNHLLPCVKATGWTATRSGRKKRIYDTPRTPYQRLLDNGILDAKTKTRLEHEHAKLNPARITRRINQIQQQLIELASARTQGTRPAA